MERPAPELGVAGPAARREEVTKVGDGVASHRLAADLCRRGGSGGVVVESVDDGLQAPDAGDSCLDLVLIVHFREAHQNKAHISIKSQREEMKMKNGEFWKAEKDFFL